MAKDRIHIMTINACNNNCIFCCSRHPWIMSRQGTYAIDAVSLAAECGKQKGIDDISFTGGESTLHKDLPLLVRQAKTMGYRNIALQTNGRMLKYKGFCIELLESGINEISISLHGSRPKIHDALTRSPGAFEQAYAGLRNVIALKRSYPLKIHTNFTVTKLNYKDIHDYISLLLSLRDIDGIVLNTLMIAGNADLFFDQLSVSYAAVAREFCAAIDKLCDHERRAPLPVNIVPMPLCLMQGYEQYVGVQEIPIEVNNNEARPIQRAGRPEKNIKCFGCRYEKRCAGIDSLYAQRVGWSEIAPPSTGACEKPRKRSRLTVQKGPTV